MKVAVFGESDLDEGAVRILIELMLKLSLSSLTPTILHCIRQIMKNTETAIVSVVCAFCLRRLTEPGTD